MIEITFIEHNGNKHQVMAETGESLMVTAVKNLIPGIVAECGGSLSCATCHVYIDSPWNDRIKNATSEENVMLDCALDTNDSSRLACQIEITAELEGMEVNLPELQY